MGLKWDNENVHITCDVLPQGIKETVFNMIKHIRQKGHNFNNVFSSQWLKQIL